jgi:Spy/CpxP family protein refolding chaperone
MSPLENCQQFNAAQKTQYTKIHLVEILKVLTPDQRAVFKTETSERLASTP